MCLLFLSTVEDRQTTERQTEQDNTMGQTGKLYKLENRQVRTDSNRQAGRQMEETSGPGQHFTVFLFLFPRQALDVIGMQDS